MSKLARILKARANAWAAQRQEEIARSDLHDDQLDSGIHQAPEGLMPLRQRSRESIAKLPAVAPINAKAKASVNKMRAAAGSLGNVEPLLQEVTLIVYGWHNVQPGPLSWVFPSVRQAIAAAKAMRNAVCWAVVRGHEPPSALDDARRHGTVLLEHAG